MLASLKKAAFDPTDSTALQAPRALLASVAALGLDVSIFLSSMHYLQWNWFAAALTGYLAGVVLQYVLCRVWVFSNAEQQGGFVSFAVLSLFGLGITWSVLQGLHEMLGVHPLVAKSAAVGLSFAWNFLSRKWLLFRAAPGTNSSAELDLAPSQTGAELA
ncbi:MAG: GtrA family protein [Gemmataceae bacterium]|nr:GtrA family protein [Gemmataceae bacterium]